MAVMLCVRHPLSLRNVEDLLSERGGGICHEMVRFWWNRFGPMFADEIRRGERHYRWRSTDHEGEILETYVTKKTIQICGFAVFEEDTEAALPG